MLDPEEISEDDECMQPLSPTSDVQGVRRKNAGDQTGSISAVRLFLCGSLFSALLLLASQTAVNQKRLDNPALRIRGIQQLVGVLDESAKCKDAEVGDDCWVATKWAKHEGIYSHPDWYPGVGPEAKMTEFQALVHISSPEECPYAPCSNSAPGREDVEEDKDGKACQDAQVGDACWKAVRWGQTNGIYVHPDWYPGLTPQSSFGLFQAQIHKSNSEECPFAPCSEAGPTNRLQGGKFPVLTDKIKGLPSLIRDEPAREKLKENWEPGVLSKSFAYSTNVNITCAEPFIPVANPEATKDTGFNKTMECGCPPAKTLDDSGKFCVDSNGPAKMTFYLYRAQGDDDYAPENVNGADLAGLMWYLHNEVVGSTPRKFDVSRIIRYRLTLQNTWEFFKQYPKQFGSFVAFDSGRCTVPDCDSIWESYGFVVGCQNLDRNVANYVRDYRQTDDLQEIPKPDDLVRVRKLEELSDTISDFGVQERPLLEPVAIPTTTSQTTTLPPITDSFKSGTWYSLPGGCPNSFIDKKTATCQAAFPGGACQAANGEKDCTYSYEYAGEIRLDDVSGILDEARGIYTYDDWWKNSIENCMEEVARGVRSGPCAHHAEYNALTDKGEGCSFWNGKHDVKQGLRRMNRVRQLFRLKYPDLPDDYPEPDCL